MTQPLTRQQENDLVDYGGDAALLALARLRFLERKVQAAQVLADEVRVGYGLRAAQFAIAYDTVPGMEP